MAAAITYLLETPDAYDFYFIVGPQQERVGVVRTLLAECSQPLHRLLLSSDPGDMKETEDLPDGHVDAINILLKYAYGALDSKTLCGDLMSWSKETAVHVLYLADKYLIHPLKEMALVHLVPTGVDDLFPALHCVVTFDAEILETPVLKIVQEETEKVLAHPHFVDIDVTSLTFILKQDILRVQDLELWKAALTWAKHQGATEDPETLRRLLQKPLQHIRLYTLTRKEFWQHVEPTKIFSAHELVDYIKAVDHNLFCATKCFSNSVEKRVNYIIADLQAHNDETSSERVSECIIKLEKNAKLNTVVCHGRTGGSLDSYTTTVTIRLYGGSEPGDHMAECVQTAECQFNADVVLKQLQGVGDVELSAGCVYRLFVKFSKPQPVKASVKGDSSYCGGHEIEIGRLDCVKYNGSRPYSTHFKRILFSPWTRYGFEINNAS